MKFTWRDYAMVVFCAVWIFTLTGVKLFSKDDDLFVFCQATLLLSFATMILAGWFIIDPLLKRRRRKNESKDQRP
jgi:predicted tellurium resistance membrane protein TerC